MGSEMCIRDSVRKIPFVLIDHLSSFNDDLPSAAMATEVHHSLRAVDFDSCRRGRPVRPLGAKADFARELTQIPRGITTLAGHREVAVIVGDTHLRTITTRELGGPSLIYKRFKSDRMVKMLRCPNGEIK